MLACHHSCHFRLVCPKDLNACLVCLGSLGGLLLLPTFACIPSLCLSTGLSASSQRGLLTPCSSSRTSRVLHWLALFLLFLGLGSCPSHQHSHLLGPAPPAP